MHINIVMMTPLPRNTLEVGEVIAAVIRFSTGLTIAYLVYLMARRIPWPTPFRARFALLHVILAPIAALSWYALSTGIESVMPGSLTDLVGSDRIEEMLFIGCIFYTIVVGISHSVEGSKRASRAEAVAAETQLAALRAQLQPHFLFNALHTVVQLIPIDPNRAMEAAELVAGLLRTTME
ncbi:MAG TPA: histidine kinase, partial [Longimicrobiales bacterium]|nr:histidine kinase [Longimicrobiales bacterium]